jgi:hypothetical protein
MQEEVHKGIEDNEVIERYVLDKLSAAERRAFQEHFFECERCFQQVQASTRFIAGVRAASKAGLLAAERPGSHAASGLFGSPSLRPIFALSVAVSLILALALGWLWFGRLQKLENEIARERQTRADLEQASRQEIQNAVAQLEESRRQLEGEQAERARLEERLQPRGGAGPVATTASSQANIPIVTLESSRDPSAVENRITVPRDAHSLVLWVVVEPTNRFASFEVEIQTKAGRFVERIAGARPNQYGALAVSIPANRFQPGQYVVRLYGARGPQNELLGEYDLRVARN